MCRSTRIADAEADNGEMLVYDLRDSADLQKVIEYHQVEDVEDVEAPGAVK